MKTSALLARFGAFAILLFAFGVAVYRAKTQPIAHAEALTYEWFLAGGVDKLLHFDANNHVLFTFLSKPLVKFLVPTQLSLPPPSLLRASAYLCIPYFLL